MASPQMEKGFTPISNEILEAVAGARLNGTQLRILLLLWRNSYGFHKKDCFLPLSYLTKMLRGNKSTISREVRRLEQLGLVLAVSPADSDGHTPKIYRFNKDYAQWKSGAGPAEPLTQPVPSDRPGVGREANKSDAVWLTDKNKKINKNKFYSKNVCEKNSAAKRKSRYDYDEIERRTFLNVTKQFREGEQRYETDE